MNVATFIRFTAFIATMLVLVNCSKKQDTENPELVQFTKADSLTEVCLELQDTMVSAWNVMVNDDNKKLVAMKNLAHELNVVGQFTPDEFEHIQQRLNQLKRIRYTYKTVWNADIVQEYDFASSSIINELITKTESYPAYAYNTVLQRLVEEIRAAEQRVEVYRSEYDRAAGAYNDFIEKNKTYLRDISTTLEKKPTFQTVSD